MFRELREGRAASCEEPLAERAFLRVGGSVEEVALNSLQPDGRPVILFFADEYVPCFCTECWCFIQLALSACVVVTRTAHLVWPNWSVRVAH